MKISESLGFDMVERVDPYSMSGRIWVLWHCKDVMQVVQSYKQALALAVDDQSGEKQVL